MSGPVCTETLSQTRTCSRCGRTRDISYFQYFREGSHDICMDCFETPTTPTCPWCNGTMHYDGKTGAWECPNGCHDVTPEDKVLSPSHYTAGGIETIDFIRAKLTPDEFRGYLKGSIIKYLSRANLKGSEDEDYAKASFYATMLTGEDPREVS